MKPSGTRKAGEELDLDGLNDALAAGLKDPEKQDKIDEVFQLIKDFSDSHVTRESTDCLDYLVEQKGPRVAHMPNGEVIRMMINDIPYHVSEINSAKPAVNKTPGTGGQS